MDADIEAAMPPTEQEEKLATLGGEELLDKYRDEIVRLCAGRGQMHVRVPVRSEILRRLLLAEPPTFGGQS